MVAVVVSREIAGKVPGVTVLPARQVVDFQQRNIYWNTVGYKQLAERLGVSRVVLIDLSEYRLHEPGNSNVWRGLLSGHAGVAEADSDRPNDLVYATDVTANYPPDKPLGLLNADQRTIRMATLDLFSRAVAGKFYDHTIERGE